MDANNIMFPAIWFKEGLFLVAHDFDHLTTTNALALKRRFYEGLIIVDSNGKAWRVKSARKLQGVGLFWGYNICFNRRIKVELTYDGEPFQMSIEEVRKRVLSSFQSWHGWQTRDDFDTLKTSVEKATTIAEIIRLVDS